MKTSSILAGVAALGLAACAQQIDGPVGAPDPTHPDMTFIDGNGCSWWVIGNATSYSWAKTTNAKGEHVCHEDPAAPPEPNPGVPYITPDNADAPILPAPTPVAPGKDFVQVATFANADNANRSMERFRNLGLPVRPSSGTAGADGFYRLVLGPFSDTASAVSALTTARAEGFADAFSYKR